MTLHTSKDNVGLRVERIKEWEIGSSEQALLSCKETFFQEPNHFEYNTEIDHGTNIVRCSSWRNVLNIVFSEIPPFH